MGLYVPTSLTLIDVESKGLVGALGVWTSREAHQPGARDDLSGPLPFWYTWHSLWQIMNGRKIVDDLAEGTRGKQ